MIRMTIQYVLAAYRSTLSRIFKRNAASKAPVSPAVQSLPVADPTPAKSIDSTLEALLGPDMAASMVPTADRVAAVPATPVPSVEEVLGYPQVSAPAIDTAVHVVPASDMEAFIPGRPVDLAALLRDIDRAFPQIPVKPTSTMEEIQFNAGQRSLADWMRQQYLNRGKQAGSMSKTPSI
ncbi:hypothetical protein [Aeromonas caviae]|uniref:hypothetical protein n=1 Tax=Aeromonas caviae TaxID=648 RepID=UPI0038D1B198